MFSFGLLLPSHFAFATLLPNMPKQTQQLVLMLIIGVLIGTTAVMAWKNRQVGVGTEVVNSTPTGASTSPENVIDKTTIGQAPGLPAAPQIPKNTRIGLSVNDQPAGNIVHISGLSLTENHWIAVYDDKDGHPGWIMGAARAHVGDTTAEIELMRGNVSGGTYYAAILNDDGDDVFNRLTDLPPLSPDKVVVVSFVAE